ncbi:MAG: ABC transporter ATP-binding protein [Acetobacteraceae bacterium]
MPRNEIVPEPKCELRGLHKSFGGRPVVTDVSLSVAEGEFVVILGPSGCGKTTTLRMIAGLDQPDTGSIAIGGAVMSAPEQGRFVRPERRSIGMVFQSYAIWPHMTVFENVAYPLRVRRVGKAEMRGKVDRVLELVGLAGEGPRAPATALSGGQMQRVALARALVFDPALLLFDEPLSNLDLKLRERLRLELKALQRRTGLTSIYVTHDQAEAVELADRIVVMQGGRIVQTGRPEALYREPSTRFVAEFIATANIFRGAVQAIVAPGIARVGTEAGFSIVARHDAPVAIGDRVDVVIHPEDCALNAAAAGGDGHAVTVLEARFQGTATRYTVALHDLRFDVMMLGTGSPLAPDLRCAAAHRTGARADRAGRAEGWSGPNPRQAPSASAPCWSCSAA